MWLIFCLLLGERALFPVPEPINQCVENIILRQVFSGENKGYRFTKEKCPFNILFQKMSLEIEELAQKLLKFSWSQSWSSSTVEVLSTDDKVWIEGTETSLLIIFYVLNIRTFWDILEIGFLIGKLIFISYKKMQCQAQIDVEWFNFIFLWNVKEFSLILRK